MALNAHRCNALQRASLRCKTWVRTLSLAALAITLGGCADMAYLHQAAAGHVGLVWKSRSLADVLADPQSSERLKDQLQAAQTIRRFAVDTLALPDNASYTRYVDTGQPFVVWNVLATRELSLKLESFCFWVVGCLNYKGYYSEADAQAFAQLLRERGLEVTVAGVPAYSTLGWTPDPLVNTFIYYPKGELARLVFHELAHQVLYVADDTAFNESFATAVEELGVELWLQNQADGQVRREYEIFDVRRKRFQALLQHTRAALKALYDSDLPDADKRTGRDAIFADLQARYRQVREEEWGGYAGYDRFFRQEVNTPRLAGHGLYRQWVPALKALFVRSGSDFKRFFEAAADLGRLEKSARQQRLAAMENPELSGAVFLPDFIVRERASGNDSHTVLGAGDLGKIN
jgi:predicted aminopeptidase